MAGYAYRQLPSFKCGLDIYIIVYIQIPQIFYKLQTSVQAVLLGSVLDTEWFSHGVPSDSLAESWPLPLPDGCAVTDNAAHSVACDGKFLYFHGPFGLLKVGSGYANTKKVWRLLFDM